MCFPLANNFSKKHSVCHSAGPVMTPNHKLHTSSERPRCTRMQDWIQNLLCMSAHMPSVNSQSILFYFLYHPRIWFALFISSHVSECPLLTPSALLRFQLFINPAALHLDCVFHINPLKSACLATFFLIKVKGFVLCITPGYFLRRGCLRKCLFLKTFKVEMDKTSKNSS